MNAFGISRSGAALAALFLVGGCAPQVQACGDEPILAGVRGEIAARVGLPVQGVTEVTTIGSNDTSARCSLHARFSDGRESDYTYALALSGGETRFEITGDIPTHGVGGTVVAPGAAAAP